MWRITIPAENQWGLSDAENVWIKLNQQYYPDGYDDLDLFYLITGRWTDTQWYGYGDIDKDNWEEIIISPTRDIDYNNRKVTFKIKSTDYMYILGYKDFWNYVAL